VLPLLLVVGLSSCQTPAPPADPSDPAPADGSAAQPADDADEADADEADAHDADELIIPLLHPSVDDYPEAIVTLRRQGAEPLRLPVKLAATAERRRHGLMEVPELPAGTGMLFTFDGDQTGGFWMKDTLVPLDIAFVDAEGTIVAILAMDPCESDPCEVYEPEVAYRSALEVPQGWFAASGIEVGDELTAVSASEG
jgi:uncharacterized protein